MQGPNNNTNEQDGAILNRNTNNALLTWRERERQARTVRVLIMFLLMLMLMDGEEPPSNGTRRFDPSYSNTNNNNDHRDRMVQRGKSNTNTSFSPNARYSNQKLRGTTNRGMQPQSTVGTGAGTHGVLSPTVWQARQAQEAALYDYYYHRKSDHPNERILRLRELNGGQEDYGALVWDWLHSIVQASRRVQNLTHGEPIVARESDLLLQQPQQQELPQNSNVLAAAQAEQTPIYVYPTNATGFYRGQWILLSPSSPLPLPSTTTAVTNATAMPNTSTLSTTVQGTNQDNPTTTTTTTNNVTFLEPTEWEQWFLQRHGPDAGPGVYLLPAARGDDASAWPMRQQLQQYAIKVRDDHNLTTLQWDQMTVDAVTGVLYVRGENHNERVVASSSAKLLRFQSDFHGEGDDKTKTAADNPAVDTVSQQDVFPRLSLTRSFGRAAVQLYSRPVPGMKQLSLVDGFVKLYDSSPSSSSAASSAAMVPPTLYVRGPPRDVLLRVRGVLLHAIGKISLVSAHTPVIHSAFFLPPVPPHSSSSQWDSLSSSTTTTATTLTKRSRNLRQTDAPAVPQNQSENMANDKEDVEQNKNLASSVPPPASASAGKNTNEHAKPLTNVLPNSQMVEQARRRLQETLSSAFASYSWNDQDKSDLMLDSNALIRDAETLVSASSSSSSWQRGWKPLLSTPEEHEGFPLDKDKDEKQQQQQQGDIPRSMQNDYVSARSRTDRDDVSIYNTVLDDEFYDEPLSSNTAREHGRPRRRRRDHHRRLLQMLHPSLDHQESSDDSINTKGGQESNSATSHRILPQWSDIVIPFPYVRDDEEERLRKMRTPGSRRMPYREQVLERNGHACHFEIALDLEPVEWTLTELRTFLRHKWNENKRLDPYNPVNIPKNESDLMMEDAKKPKSGLTTSLFPSSSNPTSYRSSSKRKLQNKKPWQDEALVMQMVGVIRSDNCQFAASINVTALRTDWDATTSLAIHYSFYVMLVCLVQIILLLRQLLHSQTTSAATRVSLIGIAWQTVIDALLCLGHIYLCLALQPLFTAFASVAFFKCLIFCVIEMKYMTIIIQARNSAAGGQPLDVLRRQVAVLHLRFYAALMATFIVLFHLQEEYRMAYMLLLYSFWLPQIILNVATECRTPLHRYYIYGMAITRMVVPVYMLGIHGNFLRQVYPETPYDPWTCLAIMVWVGFQTSVLIGQSKYGARFFIPRQFLPPKYDYSRPIPPSILANARHDTTSLPETTTEFVDTTTATAVPNQDRNATSVTTRNRKRPRNGNHSQQGRITNVSALVPSALGDEATSASLSRSGSPATTSSGGGVPGTTSKISTPPPSAAGVAATMETCASPSACLDCSICYEPIDVAHHSYMLAPCDHVFHKDCLIRWMDVKMECPICRTELPAL